MSAAQNEFNELMRDKSHRRRHPEDEDDDDAHSFLNISDDDFDDSPPSPAPEALTPRPSMSIPTRRYGANTGPKGVISDAQNFRDSRRSQRSSMTSTRPTKQSSRSSSRQVPESTIDEDDDDLDDDGPGDQGFMARWRQSRIREMQSGPRDSKMHLNGRSRNTYGGMTAVDGEGYLDAVDNSGPDTVVVVYIYDEYVSFWWYEQVMHDLTFSSPTSVSCLRHVYELWRVNTGLHVS